jgi:hypothetical protein
MLAVWGVVAGCASAPPRDDTVNPLTAAERAAVSHVNRDGIRDVTHALTAPRFDGRGTGSAGGARAAAYIASRLERSGLQPVQGTASLLQTFAVYRTTIDTMRSVMRLGQAVLHDGVDFLPLGAPLPATATVRGPVVFVGFGVQDSASGHDDLRTIDVRGKIVMLLIDRPPSAAQTDAPSWTTLIGGSVIRDRLVERGARALLLVDRRRPSRLPLPPTAPAAGVVRADTLSPVARCPMVLVSEKAAAAFFAVTPVSLATAAEAAATDSFVPHVLDEDAELTIAHRHERLETSNVVARLAGASPTRADDVVLVMAHYDAFGPDESGRIRAGAADNALGTATLLAVADALAKGSRRPDRTVIFMATTGEEIGMLGALHWADHPAVPLSRIVATINIDGIGSEILGPVTRVVGFGSDLSSLGTLFARATQDLGMRPEPDPFGAQRPFYRSDHIVFARRGVPALMLLGLPRDSVAVSLRRMEPWVQSAYHGVADTIRSDWNWDGPRDLAAVTLLTVLRVANAAVAPVWNATSPFQRP